MTQEEKAQKLGNEALSNPSLLDVLTEDIFLKFVVFISKYDKELACKVFDLKSGHMSAQSKILFWEAVGILRDDSQDYSL